MKFKVGDKVKVGTTKESLDNIGISDYKDVLNKEGTVVKDFRDGYVEVAFEHDFYKTVKYDLMENMLNKQQNMQILPKVPGELLKIALRDMKNTIDSGYSIDMHSWGENLNNPNLCSVCFAGAVMMNTLNVKPSPEGGYDNIFDISPIVQINSDQLSALNYIRKGDFYGFLFKLKVHYNTTDVSAHRCGLSLNGGKILGWKNYEDCDNNQEFYKQIEDLIKFLTSEGF